MKITGKLDLVNKGLVDLDISKFNMTEGLSSTTSSVATSLASSLQPTIDASQIVQNNMPELGNTI